MGYGRTTVPIQHDTARDEAFRHGATHRVRQIIDDLRAGEPRIVIAHEGGLDATTARLIIASALEREYLNAEGE